MEHGVQEDVGAGFTIFPAGIFYFDMAAPPMLGTKIMAVGHTRFR